MPPTHIFSVHHQHDAVDRTGRHYQVLHHHKEIPDALHVIKQLRVGVFESGEDDPFVFAREKIRQFAHRSAFGKQSKYQTDLTRHKN